MKTEEYKPLTTKELEEHFGLVDADDFKELVKTLVQMEEQGKLYALDRIVMVLPQRMNLVVGKFIGHAKGFGFVAPEEVGMDDIFIPPT